MTSRAPDLRLAGFSLWIHGWEVPNNPEQQDYWDANWLRVTAVYRSPGATVTVDGPILQAAELQRFLNGCRSLETTLTGAVEFDSMDPGFRLVLTGNGRGKIELCAQLSADIITEQHQFEAEIDQSYLPDAIDALEGILRTFAPREGRTSP